MEFYEVLSRYYDRVFPLEEEILGFLRARFAGRSPLLDVACGTGTYTLELAAEPGRKIAGVDLDEVMVASAGDKARARGLEGSVSFAAADMLDLGGVAEISGFAGLYCIGNSLVHLADHDQVRRALGGFARILAPGGRLLVQVINFDRILKKNVRELPTLRGEEVEFIRRYLPGPDAAHLWFDTDLLVGGPQGEKFTQRVSLLILRSADLAAAAGDAGFRRIKLYGSYRGGEYSPEESFVTILEAERA